MPAISIHISNRLSKTFLKGVHQDVYNTGSESHAGQIHNLANKTARPWFKDGSQRHSPPKVWPQKTAPKIVSQKQEITAY